MRKSFSGSPIEDQMIHSLGLDRFQSATVSPDGLTLELNLQGGLAYSVPVEYVRSWYSRGPHERTEEREQSEAKIVDDQMMVQLTLTDGSRYYIAWDVVLMTCEPRYENFGGFTERSKANTADWIERHGSFQSSD